MMLLSLMTFLKFFLSFLSLFPFDFLFGECLNRKENNLAPVIASKPQ